MDNKIEEIYESSLTKDFIFMANHCGKIYLIASSIIILLAITFGKNSISLIGTAYVVGFLGVLTYFVRLLLKRFAYKVIINFKNGTITFFLCQGQGELIVSFEEIIIRINAYVIFVLSGKRIFYNIRENQELFNTLNKIKKIEWGALCSFLGPNENIRKNFDRFWDADSGKGDIL